MTRQTTRSLAARDALAAATLCLCTGGVAAFATSPSAGGADWKLRFTLTVLLPHRT